MYSSCDVIVIAFAVNNRASFYNVKEVWRSEFGQPKQNKYVVLCGTKIDTKPTSEDFIFDEEIVQMAKDIDAVAYFEVSAFEGVGIQDLMEKCGRIGSGLPFESANKSKKCLLQ